MDVRPADFQVFRYLGETHGLSPEDWLLLRLTDLAAARRREGEATQATELPASQADLATLVGVSRQTLNTPLARVERRGLIELGYRMIRVGSRAEGPAGVTHWFDAAVPWRSAQASQ